MSTSLLEQQTYFGLFELDDRGTVLYSRVEQDGRKDVKGPDVTGQNFFNEIALFDNSEEFRKRVADFIKSDAGADHFIFNCRINSSLLPVKVLLARIRERTNSNQTKSVLIHIRKSSS